MKTIAPITILAVVCSTVAQLQAQNWRLVGATGQQGEDLPAEVGEGFLHPDHTLYEINITTAGTTKLFQLVFINDSLSIGYCPTDGLLYRTGGSQAYSNNPARLGHDQGMPDIEGVGYQDSQYLEKINLTTLVKSAVFNCAPCPSPDPLLPCFGLPAPRPSWVLPVERRDSTQVEQSFRERGEHEYSAARGLAWSETRNLFYLSDGEGIFKMTTTGECTFLARPAFPSDGKLDKSKGIAFVKIGNTTKLLVGHQDGVTEGGLMELNPDTGEVIGEIGLTYPPGGSDPIDQFNGLLGLSQHPETGVLYGIRKTSDNFSRELVTIDPVTGRTALIGNMNLHFASIAFVRANPATKFEVTQISRSGNNLTLAWTGGSPPYQVQTSPSMTALTWTNLGQATSNLQTVVNLSDSRAFLRIKGQ